MQQIIKNISQQINSLSAQQGLAFIAATYGTDAVFSTSFGIEDQAITHIIASQNLNIELFTLDTGRLFQPTYSVWNATLNKYQLPIKTFFPNQTSIQNLLEKKGPNSFYNSVEDRIECCHVRKVEPLQRALKNKKIWITGIRAQQSPHRIFDSKIEWDATNNIIKYHPILDWSFDELNSFITSNQIPVNALHQKGFVSIGCEPCTRAIKAGEDFRAGRWWWEDASKKECGLHVKQ